jgi:hypothetical protein
LLIDKEKMRILRVGLLVGNVHASKYVHELTAWAAQQPNISICRLIVCGRGRDRTHGPAVSGGPAQGLLDSIARSVLRFQTRIESSRLKKMPLHRDHDRLFDLRELVRERLEVHLLNSSVCAYRLSDEDVQRVRELNCDILIACGPDVLEGDIVSAARFGVIAFQYGQARTHRDAPAGFWEWYYKRPKTGFTLRRLAESGDGETLVRGFYRTQPRFLLNQACLYKKANHHLQDLLSRIAGTGRLPEAELSFFSGAPGFPKAHQSLWSLARFIYEYCENKLLESLRFRETWGISFLHSNWKHANLAESVEVSLPPGRSWNTPFVHTQAGRTCCFVEDDVYATTPRRGRITVLGINGDAAEEIGVCLTEPFHLAFPFLFEYEGNLYMCPESGEAGQIRVYRCTDYPLRWELCSVLMAGVAAVNTMLFERRGKWWMLTNIDRSGTDDCSSELYLFHADSPLGADWKAHPGNPVRIDSEGGRNAGLIQEGGKLFRLGQRQSYEQYGEAIIVFEIEVLTELAYAERPVGEIDASFRKGLRGVHHFSSSGAVTVVDHVSLTRGH